MLPKLIIKFPKISLLNHQTSNEDQICSIEYEKHKKKKKKQKKHKKDWDWETENFYLQKKKKHKKHKKHKEEKGRRHSIRYYFNNFKIYRSKKHKIAQLFNFGELKFTLILFLTCFFS